MPFHRLTTPTYFTGGPTFPSEPGVTYDYINNGGSGTPSFVDGPKVGSVNAGTYFFAFQDAATASNFNRAPNALAENCDHLDDLLHRSIATTIRTVDVTAGAPVSSITLPVGTFLGPAGTPDSASGYAILFEVVDSDDNEIIDAATGNKVQVTAVVLGSGDVIGGGGANGNFSGNTVQLTLSPSIPTSTTYRVYYGTRTNLATLPLDALTSITIRSAQEVPAAFLAFQNDLARTASGQQGTLLVGTKASGNWADGTNVAAGTLSAFLDEMVADLARALNGDDGAGRLGAGPYNGLVTGTVRTQINQLQDSSVSHSTTLSSLFSTKAAKAGDTFTGPIAIPTVSGLVFTTPIEKWVSLKTLKKVGSSYGDLTITIPAGSSGRQIIDLPAGMVLKGLRVRYDRGASGGTGGPDPEEPITTRIFRYTATTAITDSNIQTVLADGADPDPGGPSGTAYTFERTGFSHTILENNIYFVDVLGEDGTDALSALWINTEVLVEVAELVIV